MMTSIGLKWTLAGFCLALTVITLIEPARGFTRQPKLHRYAILRPSTTRLGVSRTKNVQNSQDTVSTSTLEFSPQDVVDLHHFLIVKARK